MVIGFREIGIAEQCHSFLTPLFSGVVQAGVCEAQVGQRALLGRAIGGGSGTRQLLFEDCQPALALSGGRSGEAQLTEQVGFPRGFAELPHERQGIFQDGGRFAGHRPRTGA